MASSIEIRNEADEVEKAPNPQILTQEKVQKAKDALAAMPQALIGSELLEEEHEIASAGKKAPLAEA
jgi:hypothetical protein